MIVLNTYYNPFRLFVTAMILHCSVNTAGQIPPKDPGPTIQAQSGVFIDDLFKIQQPYQQSQYRDIAGSPFMFEYWKEADVLLKSGQHFSKVKIKMNLYTQELIYLTQAGQEAIVQEGVVRSFSLSDSDANGNLRTRKFITGLESPDDNSGHFFYEVAADGKATLLRLTKKKIVNNSSALSPGDNKEFRETETYFIWFNNELKSCEKNASYYVQLFNDQQEKIKEFIQKNGLKCKRIDDVQKIVEYYNGI